MLIASRPIRGFTLLEMTVVLLLVAAMGLAIIEGLRLGARIYAQVSQANEGARSVAVAQRFVRRLLEAAYPFEPDRAAGTEYGLEGTADGLHLSAPAPRARSGGGFNRYHLFVAEGDAGERSRDRRGRVGDLVVTWHFDQHGAGGDSQPRTHREVLIENVARVEWSYAPASCDGHGEWQQTWQGRRDLPALVRVRIHFPTGDARQWPELIVGPRVTDDFISWSYRAGVAGKRCGSRQ